MFHPTLHTGVVTNITGDLLRKLQVKAILLDVDNTITSYSSKEPLLGTLEWAEALKKEGFSVYIVSNNFKERVSKIAAKFGLPFISFAMKPLPLGFYKARRVLGFKGKECLVVGDQVFTDILGANLAGMKSVLVDPVEEETSFTFRVRRRLEKPIRKKCTTSQEGK